MTQNEVTKVRAGSAAGMIRPPEVADLLGWVEQLLAADRPAQALAAVENSGVGSPWVDNARAVCLLRLGRSHAAVEILRGLVLDPTGFAVRADAHPVHQANYATALLLDGNTDGFLGILGGIRDRTHPAVARLDDAVRRWKSGLTWGERLRSFLGWAGRPLTLDFPLGDL